MGRPSQGTGSAAFGGACPRFSFYFFGDVLGRPRRRNVDSRPKVVAVTVCQSVVPNGCCRFTQVRRAVSS